MTNKITNWIAAVLLVFMFAIAIASITGDSLTMDEKSHLPAGYSYLTQKDIRINPEHPPLIKDLAAMPLLFIKNIKFPYSLPAWKEQVNPQWDFGHYFLYETGNPAEKIIFWGRFPMILLMLLLGFFIFKWSKELFGNTAGIIALFLYCLSPTFLAHGRLVTTDVAAAAGAFIGTYYFINALKKPSVKNILFSGVAFGIAELCKFSLILLGPLYVLLAIIYFIFKLGKFAKILKTVFFTFALGAVLIWPVYQFHVWSYPAKKQKSDTKYISDSFANRPLANALVWAADKPVIRAYGQYFLGLAMVTQRATGGNTGYFMGEVTNAGWKTYFPIVYFIKETLSLHIITLFVLILVLLRINKNLLSLPRIREWLKQYFAVVAALGFIGIYWLTSLTSNLNIGVRHLLPFLPFLFFLLAGTAVKLWLKEPYMKLKYVILGLLFAWQAASVISAYPHFLAYFNESIGGPANGYKYVVDSNLDWGQDLKRLKKWADQNQIDKIYIDYFGGSSPQYYFGEKFLPWWGTRDPNELPQKSYLAVSATFLQGGNGKAVKGFKESTDFYQWLNNKKLVARIGYSIFVFQNIDKQ